MKNRKFFWILIGIGVCLIILFILLTNIISAGEKLRSINIYLEYGFYALCFVLFWVLILNPMRIILFSPSFSIQTVLDNPKRGKKYNKVNRRVAKNLLKQNILDEIDVKALRNSLNKEETLRNELNRVFNGKMKKELNKIILSNAKTVLISTAISQNSKLDFFTIITVNLKMIKDLVVKCGFRPSMPNLGKISLNVMITALIAEGLEDMNLDDMLPNTTLNTISEIPFIKPLLSSIMQGVSNALMTLRIGIVTRKYLFSDAGAKSKTEIRIQAIKESVLLLPKVISDSISLFPKSIGRFFSKKDKAQDM